MNKFFLNPALLPCLASAPASAPPQKAPIPFGKPASHQRLYAVRWMESAEYLAASCQAYAVARRQLETALRQPDRNAVPATKVIAGAPPAIILDLDETVLDNTPYDVLLAQRNADFDEASWKRWNESGQVGAVPGAVGFAQYAAMRGVRVFYVSNRGAAEKAVTLKILHRLGLPLHSAGDVLLKNERPAWTSDKTSRREDVAMRYRVLLLLGDDLNDFTFANKSTSRQRAASAQRYRNYWGTRWILLPDPAYGSWENALPPEKESSSARLETAPPAPQFGAAPVAPRFKTMAHQ